jgi:hypothetical protein
MGGIVVTEFVSLDGVMEAPVVGVVVALFLLVGGALAPQAREQLGDPGAVGIFVGTVIQLLALVVALISGVAAASQSYRTHAGHDG